MSELSSQDDSSCACCYESISHDLQGRLTQTYSQLEESEIKNEQLENELARRTREIDYLKCENSQLTSQRRNAEDHSCILATKSELLKSDVKRHKKAIEKLQAEVSMLTTENKALRAKIENKNAKFDRVKSLVRKLEAEASVVGTLYAENKSKQSEIERLQFALSEEQRKVATLKERLKEATKSERENREKAEAAVYLEEQHEKDRSIIKALKSEKIEMDLKMRQFETQVSVLSSLKSRVADAAKLEVQVQKLEMDNLMMGQIQADLKRTQEDLEAERVKSQTLLNENLRLKQGFEDFESLSERIKTLESENIVLKGKLENYDLVEQQAKRAPWLSNQIVQLEREKRQLEAKLSRVTVQEPQRPQSERLMEETKALQMKLSVTQARKEEIERLKEEIARLNMMKTRELDEVKLLVAENQRMRAQMVALESELEEKTQNEQRLTRKYKLYKSKAREQKEAMHSYRIELRSMQMQLMALQERESMRQEILAHRHHSDDRRASEKSHSYTSRLQSQLQDIKRQLDSIKDD